MVRAGARLLTCPRSRLPLAAPKSSLLLCQGQGVPSGSEVSPRRQTPEAGRYTPILFLRSVAQFCRATSHQWQLASAGASHAQQPSNPAHLLPLQRRIKQIISVSPAQAASPPPAPGEMLVVGLSPLQVPSARPPLPQPLCCGAGELAQHPRPDVCSRS